MSENKEINIVCIADDSSRNSEIVACPAIDLGDFAGKFAGLVFWSTADRSASFSGNCDDRRLRRQVAVGRVRPAS